MELRQLRAFEAAVRHGSLTRAAAELGLSQPAVSMQVQALEEELGLRLLDRLPRRVVPTAAGELLFDYARRLLTLEDEAGRALTGLKGLEVGSLRVAASPTIGNYLLPEILGRFRRRYPGLRVIADIAPSHRVGEALRSRSAEVGLVEAEIDVEGLTGQPFCTDELVLVVPAGHPWAGRPSVEPHELLAVPFVAREPESGTRALVDDRLRSAGVAVTPAMELGGVEAIKNAVRAGLGVSFVSRHAIALEERLGVLAVVPVAGLDMRRPFYCFHEPRRYPSPALQAFLSFILEAAPDSSEGR